MLYAREISQNPGAQCARRPFSIAAAVGTVATAARSLLRAACLNVAAVCALSAPRLYRLELRAARSVAQWLDRHPIIFNALLWVLGIAFALEVFMCAPID